MQRSDPWPVFPTRLVERHHELSWLAERIERNERLITVFGPPGVGKTRLAVEALESARAAGSLAFFCELVEARSEDEMALAVVRAVAAGNVTSAPPRQAVVAALGALGPAIVVLDNFEHLVDPGVHTLAEWVEACSNVTFLVTSREVLRLPNEAALELAPLRLPASVEEIETAPASRLLLDAVGRYRPASKLTPGEHASFCDLVGRLDGLPLALEIVAPSIALLGVRLVHERLGHVLASTDRHVERGGRPVTEATPRRTLRDAIEWSWELLSEEERIMLAQCAVFGGGFTIEALEHVAASSVAGGNARILPRLMALRDKSLLHLLPSESGSRFGVYASIAAFAAEQLDALGLRAETEKLHRAYYARCARAVVDYTSVEALDLVRTERANLMLVVERAIASPVPAAREDVFAVLALFGPPLFVGEQPARLCALVDRALAVFGDAADEHTALTWLTKGALLAYYPATASEGRAALERALAIAKECGDRGLEAHVLSYLATVTASGPEDLVAKLRAATLVARESGDRGALAHTLSWTAITQCNAGDPEGALVNASEAVACATGPVQVVRARSLCAAVRLAQGNDQDASIDVRIAMEAARSHGFYAMEAEALNGLATALHMGGGLGEAETAYRSAINRCEAVGRKSFAAALRIFLALALFENNQTQAALEEVLLVEGVLDESFDPTRPPALGLAVAAMARARLRGARVEPAVFTDAKVSAEAAAVLARLAVVADLDAAQRAHAAQPGSGDALARAARERFGAMSGHDAEAKARGSVERALLDRMVARSLAHYTDPLPVANDALVVHSEGDWFRMPGGATVTCQQRQVLRLLLRALALARRDRPGTSVSADELLETGWPGEQMTRVSGRNRIKQAMAVLRRLGLGDVLIGAAGGYRLSESTPLRLA